MARISNFEQQFDDWIVIKNRRTVCEAFECLVLDNDQKAKQVALEVIHALTDGT